MMIFNSIVSWFSGESDKIILVIPFEQFNGAKFYAVLRRKKLLRKLNFLFILCLIDVGNYFCYWKYYESLNDDLIDVLWIIEIWLMIIKSYNFFIWLRAGEEMN